MSKTPDTSEGESSNNDEAMQSDTESDEREAVEFTPTDLNPKGKSTLQRARASSSTQVRLAEH